MAFSDWNTDASQNTTVGSVFIGENCPPGNLNNGLREIMAQARSAFSRALDGLFSANSLGEARASLKALGTEGQEKVTGNLGRSGAGGYVYHANPTYAAGRIFITSTTDSDPTSQPGDIWIQVS